MTQSAPTEKTTKAAAAPTRVAVGYNPEAQEPLLANCDGGALSFQFGIAKGTTEPALRIVPGLNIGLDPELWAKAKELEQVQDLLALNVLQELPLPSEATPLHAPGVLSLRAVDDTSARRLVHLTRDQDQLRAWLQKEQRGAIRKAIGQRLKELDRGTGLEVD